MPSKQWTIKNVLTSMLMLTFLGPVNADVQKGPYLIYDGLNTGMTVLWQLDSTQSCNIEWGEDTSYETGTAGTTESGNGTYQHQHIYAITALAPSKQYFYQVSCDSDYVGSGSFFFFFSDDVDSIKFMVYGDTRSNPDDHDVVSDQMINTYVLDSGYQSITLHVGDWVNNGDLEVDWASQFFDPFFTYTNEFQANMPINGVIGNHEGSGVLFYKYFPYLYEPDGYYWSFDYGPAHIAVIDQYVDDSLWPEQIAWLETDLASSTKKWKFLVLHEPGWSAGGHSNNAAVQDDIQPLAVRYGVDMIFAGHNHYYARAVVDGIQHITTGGGGAPLYSPNPNAENIVASSQSFHFCEIDIQGDDLYFTARDEGGLELDEFDMNHLASNNSFAYSDFPVKGTVSGSYTDTHDLDGSVQTIDERSSGGKPSKRYSYLEHKWAFRVQSGAAMTLFAEVIASVSDDGDAFAFAWSTDDIVYTTMFTVDDSSAPAQSYSLDPTTSGTLYVRVVDTDRTAGTSGLLDSISVDQIFIRTDKEPGDAPATPSELKASAVSSSEILLEWLDNANDEYGFSVKRWDGDDSIWVEIATPGADVVDYTDSGLQPVTNYRYRVSAFNGAGNSPPSFEDNATTYEGSLIELTASGYKVRGVRMVDLAWSGAGTDDVDIYRNGTKPVTTSNDGFYTDIIGKSGGSYTYQVCDTGSDPDCSNMASVTF